jgi:hypothetical protein
MASVGRSDCWARWVLVSLLSTLCQEVQTGLFDSKLVCLRYYRLGCALLRRLRLRVGRGGEWRSFFTSSKKIEAQREARGWRTPVSTGRNCTQDEFPKSLGQRSCGCKSTLWRYSGSNDGCAAPFGDTCHQSQWDEWDVGLFHVSAFTYFIILIWRACDERTHILYVNIVKHKSFTRARYRAGKRQ